MWKNQILHITHVHRRHKENLIMFVSKGTTCFILRTLVILYSLCWTNDLIQNDRRSHTKFRSTYYLYFCHDDVIKWKHFPRYWPFVRGIHRSSVNSPHKGQLRGALMFSLIRAWINGWVNNREAADLRRHLAHYDVIVMFGATMIFLFDVHNIVTSYASITRHQIWNTRIIIDDVIYVSSLKLGSLIKSFNK